MDPADITQTLNTLCSVFSFVLGTMIGSFLNVCVYRLPKGLSVVKPRSKCPRCDNPISWQDNIPLMSWLALGAKCRHCKAPISWQYPLVEAITGLLFFLVFWRFGLSAATPVYMLLAASLVLVTFVDLTDWTIPNEVTFPGIPLGIVCSVIMLYYPESLLHVEGPFELPIYNSILGVVAGGGTLWLLDKISLLLLKKRGMGFGDVKLLAMLGAFFGLYGVLIIIFIASVLGAVIGLAVVYAHKPKGDEGEQESEGISGHYLPFGPYLALAGVIYMLYGPDIIAKYLSVLPPAGSGTPIIS
jgi:leader peptidase (prepilin peptidase)/N-methyltransferase